MREKTNRNMGRTPKTKRMWLVAILCLWVAAIAYGAQINQEPSRVLPQGLSVIQQASPSTRVATSEIQIDFRDFQQAGKQMQGIARSVSDGLEIEGASKQASMISDLIEAPSPFESIVPKWIVRLSQGATLIITVRASADGQNWSEWRTVTINEDATTPDENETVGKMLFFDRDMRFIQYAIQLGRPKGADSPKLRQLRFFFVDPGESPKSVASSNEALVVSDEQLSAAALAQKPSIISRTAWGCPDGQTSRQASTYTVVTHLIVHHTGDDGPSSTDYAKWVRSIWSYHTLSNGWGDIGYNFLIAPDGKIFEGRAGGDNVMGFHFSCANEGTFGVALLGDFSSSRPTAAALDSLKRLLAWKAGQRNIDPTGISYHGTTRLNLFNISGHRDANSSTHVCNGSHATSCPGDQLYSLLSCLRVDVAGLIGQATGDFSLSVSPNAVSLFTPQGSSASFPVVIRSSSPFNRLVSLSLSGLPAGASVSFSPQSLAPPIGGSVSSNLSIKTSASTPAGSYPLSVTASSCDLTRTVQVFLIVSPAPGNITVNAKLNGVWWPMNASGAVNYSIVGPSTTSIGTGVPSNFNNLPPGQYRFTYKSGGPGTFISVTPSFVQNLSSSSTIVFTLNFAAPPADFSVSVTPTTQTVYTGGNTFWTITLRSLNGFSGPVDVAALNLPPRYSSATSLSPTPVTLKANSSVTTTLKIATNSSTQKGTFTVNIRATGGGLTRWDAITVIVK